MLYPNNSLETSHGSFLVARQQLLHGVVYT